MTVDKESETQVVLGRKFVSTTVHHLGLVGVLVFREGRQLECKDDLRMSKPQHLNL